MIEVVSITVAFVLAVNIVEVESALVSNFCAIRIIVTILVAAAQQHSSSGRSSSCSSCSSYNSGGVLADGDGSGGAS